jgi:hypothetical protein
MGVGVVTAREVHQQTLGLHRVIAHAARGVPLELRDDLALVEARSALGLKLPLRGEFAMLPELPYKAAMAIFQKLDRDGNLTNAQMRCCQLVVEAVIEAGVDNEVSLKVFVGFLEGFEQQPDQQARAEALEPLVRMMNELAYRQLSPSE